MPPVTKAEALRRFVEERVVGRRQHGLRLREAHLHLRSQGERCAIGCLLPADLARRLDARIPLSDLVERDLITGEHIEDPTSGFWTDLQLAHDYLAMYPQSYDSTYLRRFEDALRAAQAAL